MPSLKKKRAGMTLDMRTFKGAQDNYLVFRLDSGAFHVFVETEAKQAARDCGVPDVGANTRVMWQKLWEKRMR